MKKVLKPAAIGLIAALQICNTAVFAATAGNYYATDIKVYMKDQLINSYNLGGKTAIICEDLSWYYGFEVEWKEDSRELVVTDGKSNDIEQNINNLPKDYYKPVTGEVGSVAGEIFTTDIKTYLNGNIVPSFNIGGRTIILCEDMRKYGYQVDWEEEKREVRIKYNPQYLPIDIGEVIPGDFIVDSDAWPNMLIPYNLRYNGQIIDTKADYALTLAGYTHTVFVPVKETLEALGVSYTWSREESRLNIIKDAISYQPGYEKSISQERADTGVYQINADLTVNGEARAVIGARRANIYPEELGREGAGIFVYRGKMYMPLDTIAACLGLDCEAGTSLKDIDKARIEKLSRLHIESGTPIVALPSGDIMLSQNVERGWFKETKPQVVITADSHGRMAPMVSGVTEKEPITITFARKIPVEYINSAYISIISNGKNISDKFIYSYDEESLTLKLTLNAPKTDLGEYLTGTSMPLRIYISDNIKDEAQDRLNINFYFDTFINF